VAAPQERLGNHAVAAGLRHRADDHAAGRHDFEVRRRMRARSAGEYCQQSASVLLVNPQTTVVFHLGRSEPRIVSDLAMVAPSRRASWGVRQESSPFPWNRASTMGGLPRSTMTYSPPEEVETCRARVFGFPRVGDRLQEAATSPRIPAPRSRSASAGGTVVANALDAAIERATVTPERCHVLPTTELGIPHWQRHRPRPQIIRMQPRTSPPKSITWGQ
jgi:hypothetical protein